MGVIGALLSIAAVVAAILIGFGSKVLADEFKAWNPRLVSCLLGWAVLKLPKASRERYNEEWASHLNDMPGDLAKLLAAIGFMIAAYKISMATNPFGLHAIFCRRLAKDCELVAAVIYALYDYELSRITLGAAKVSDSERRLIELYTSRNVSVWHLLTIRYGMLRDLIMSDDQCRFGTAVGTICGHVFAKAGIRILPPGGNVRRPIGSVRPKWLDP